MKLTSLFLAVGLFCCINPLSAQESKKIEKKIQEVIELTADPVSVEPNADGSIPANTDTPSGLPANEILKRAVNYVKGESFKYIKSNGVTTGTKAECVVTFSYKPKELNPVADVQGTISMHVSIDAKEGKYRYSISQLHHNATNAENTGGDIYNEVPKCGSMVVPLELWKHIKSEAFKQSAVVANDIKEAMKIPSNTPVITDDW